MRQRLKPEQIEQVCRELLAKHRHVTVRSVTAELRRLYGAAGRAERVCEILRETAARCPVELASGSIADLLVRLERAEKRAALAEDRERRHQDLWAARLVEKVDEVERRYAKALRARAEITVEQYLDLQRKLAELRRRLSQYEPI